MTARDPRAAPRHWRLLTPPRPPSSRRPPPILGMEVGSAHCSYSESYFQGGSLETAMRYWNHLKAWEAEPS